jgi:ABC-type multidrug transport system fused ATPase/permease subunit
MVSPAAAASSPQQLRSAPPLPPSDTNRGDAEPPGIPLYSCSPLPLPIPPPSCIQGDGAASSKSGRKAVKERLGEIQSSPPPSRDYTVKFAFEAAARKLNPPLITMERVEFGFAPGDRLLFKALDFDLSMDSRVALVGPNGCGPLPSLSA